MVDPLPCAKDDWFRISDIVLDHVWGMKAESSINNLPLVGNRYGPKVGHFTAAQTKFCIANGKQRYGSVCIVQSGRSVGTAVSTFYNPDSTILSD